MTLEFGVVSALIALLPRELRSGRHMKPTRPARHIKVTCVRYSDNPDAKIFWNPSEPKTYKTSTYPYLLPSRTIVVNCPFADNGADPAKNTNTE